MVQIVSTASFCHMTYMLAFSKKKKKRKRRKKAINIISLLTAMENVTEGGLKGLHNPK